MISLEEITDMENEIIRPHYIYPKANVLFAEDMKVNQKIFQTLTAPWQFRVDFASNGKEAVSAVNKTEYQLIFLDMKMPYMDGIEAAKIIRSMYDTPLILVTAEESDNAEEIYRQNGFSAILKKPLDLKKLRNILEEFMPASYRVDADLRQNRAASADIITDNIKANTAKLSLILKAFVSETAPLVELLPDYAKNDPNMFEIKVHGIKGTSLQIGKTELSEWAEVMEMAAKTKNFSFIGRHLNSFISKLEITLHEINKALLSMPSEKKLSNNSDGREQKPFQPADKLFKMLKTGFENYDLTCIEENLSKLNAADLNENQKKLLEKAWNAYDELEYEIGAELLKDFTN